MKPLKTLAAICAVLFCSFENFGASTNGVTAGASIQAAIDISAAGDTIFMEPGLYQDPFTVTKPLTFVVAAAPGGGQAQLFGKVTVQNTGANSFQQCFFGTNVETIGASVTILDSQCNAPVFARGGKLTLKRDLFTGNAPLTLTNSAGLEALRLTINAPVSSYGTAANPSQILAVQSAFNSSALFSTNKCWLGYNSFLGISFQPGPGYPTAWTFYGCDSILIGNKGVGYSPGGNNLLVYSSGGTLRMYNNIISGWSGYVGAYGSSRGIWLDGTLFESINNTFICAYNALIVRNAVGPVNLRNTIFSSQQQPTLDVASNSSTLVFANACLFSAPDNAQNQASVPFIKCIINQDPFILADGTLRADSPCINAGMSAPIYNNRIDNPDGPRNTMGYTGGPYLNLANYTNNAPMVFFLNGPQTILKGAVSSISVSAAASAGH